MNIEIEKNIPLVSTHLSEERKELLSVIMKMEVTDSIFLDTDRACIKVLYGQGSTVKSIRTFLREYAKRNDRKFATRLYDDNKKPGMRIWRTE